MLVFKTMIATEVWIILRASSFWYMLNLDGACTIERECACSLSESDNSQLLPFIADVIYHDGRDYFFFVAYWIAHMVPSFTYFPFSLFRASVTWQFGICIQSISIPRPYASLGWYREWPGRDVQIHSPLSRQPGVVCLSFRTREKTPPDRKMWIGYTP